MMPNYQTERLARILAIVTAGDASRAMWHARAANPVFAKVKTAVARVADDRRFYADGRRKAAGMVKLAAAARKVSTPDALYILADFAAAQTAIAEGFKTFVVTVDTAAARCIAELYETAYRQTLPIAPAGRPSHAGRPRKYRPRIEQTPAAALEWEIENYAATYEQEERRARTHAEAFTMIGTSDAFERRYHAAMADYHTAVKDAAAAYVKTLTDALIQF